MAQYHSSYFTKSMMRVLFALVCIALLNACGTSPYKTDSGKNIYAPAAEAYFNEIFRLEHEAKLTGPDDKRPWQGESPIRVKRAFFPDSAIFASQPAGKVIYVAIDADITGAVEAVYFKEMYEASLMMEIRKTISLWQFYPYTFQGKATPFRVILPIKRS